MEQQNAAGVQGYQSESAAPYTGQAQPRPDQSGAPSIGTPLLSQQHTQPQGLLPTSTLLQLGNASALTNSMFTVKLGPQTMPQPRIYSVQQTENQQYQHYQAQQQGTSNAYVVQGSQQQQGQQVQGLHLSTQQQEGFVLHGVQQHGGQLMVQGSGSNISLPYVVQGHNQQNQPTLILQSSRAFPGHHIVLASGNDGQQQLLLVSASGQMSGIQSSLRPFVPQQSSAPSAPTTAIQQQPQQQQQQHHMPAGSVTTQPQNAPLTQSTTAQSHPAANPAAAQQQQGGLLLPTLQTQPGLPTTSFAQHQQPAPPPQQQQSQQQQLQQQLMQQLQQQLQQHQQQMPTRGPAIPDTFASVQGSTGLALETPGRVLVPIRALTQGGAGAGGSSQNPPLASAAAAGACQPVPHPSSPVHSHVKAAATTSPPGSPAVGQSPRAGPHGLAHPGVSQGSLDQPSSPMSSRRGGTHGSSVGDPGGLLGPGPGRSRLSQLDGAEAGSGAGPSVGKPGRLHGASAAPRPRKRVRPAHHLMEAETKYSALTQQLQLLEAEHSMIVSKAQLLELVVQCKESQAAHLQLLHQALPSPAQQLFGPGVSLPGTSTSPPPSSSSLPRKASNVEGSSSSSQNRIILPLTPPTAQQASIFRARCQAAQLLLADLSQLSQFTIEQLGAAVAQAVLQLRMQLQPSIDKREADAGAGSDAAGGPTDVNPAADPGGVGPVACPAARLAISAGMASVSGSGALPARLSEPQVVSPEVVAGASGQPSAVEGVLGVGGPSLAALLSGPLLPTGETPDAGGSAAAVVQPPIMTPSQPGKATVGTNLSGFGSMRPGLAALVACLPLVFLCNPVAPALMGRRLVPTPPEPEGGPSAPPPVPAGLPAALQVLSMMQLAPAQLQLMADLQAWLQTCLLKQEVLHHHWAGCLRRLMRLENSSKAKSFRVQLGGPFLRQAELFEESVKLLCANQLLVALVVEVTCSCILSPMQLEMLVAASWPTFPDFLSLLGAASVLVTGADAEVTPATPPAAAEQPDSHPCPGSSSP